MPGSPGFSEKTFSGLNNVYFYRIWKKIFFNYIYKENYSHMDMFEYFKLFFSILDLTFIKCECPLFKLFNIKGTKQIPDRLSVLILKIISRRN